MNVVFIVIGAFLTLANNNYQQNLNNNNNNYLQYNHNHLRSYNEHLNLRNNYDAIRVRNTHYGENDFESMDHSTTIKPPIVHYRSVTRAELSNIDPEWSAWKKTYNKTYDGFDKLKKLVFQKNKQAVDSFNENMKDDAGFELELNHLADKSELEMAAMNGYRPSRRPLRNNKQAKRFLAQILSDNSTVPNEVDWRNVTGRVSPVKNQGSCGSCWAFAAVGVLEGQEAVNGKDKLIELSEQNLVDCSDKFGNYGCNGGLMSNALSFVKDEGGIDSEESYPYEARDGKCRFKKDKIAFSDNGYAILPTGDEEKLKEVVAKYGPVSVAIDASSIWFQLYRKGVYYNKRCKNKEDQLDHGVLVVGYGTDAKKGDYWIVKNSWGPHYGEKGYIRMARNRGNNCGIATVATIATF